MARVMGVDPSAKATGVVVLDEDPNPILAMDVSFPKQRGFERAMSIAKGIQEFAESEDVGLVALEGYAYGNMHSLATLVEVGTLIRRSLLDSKVGWITVAPTALKKYATGSGNAKKEQVLLHVYRQWAFHAETSHLADAYVLAQIARDVMAGSTQVRTPAQREVVGALMRTCP